MVKEEIFIDLLLRLKREKKEVPKMLQLYSDTFGEIEFENMPDNRKEAAIYLKLIEGKKSQ